jgi:hypothetical protein
MTETDPCILGTQSCGCITFAHARPDDLHSDDEKSIARIVREGGTIERTTVGEARARPHFMAFECPHDPKGWEPEPYIDPETIVAVKRVKYRDAYTVHRGRARLGEVRNYYGWQATTGWFSRDGADDGKDPRGPVPVLGSFDRRKDAVDALIAAVDAPKADEKGGR